MKTAMKKKMGKSYKEKMPAVDINPELNKYQGKILFPKKLDLAEEQLKGIKLPEDVNKVSDYDIIK